MSESRGSREPKILITDGEMTDTGIGGPGGETKRRTLGPELNRRSQILSIDIKRCKGKK